MRTLGKHTIVLATMTFVVTRGIYAQAQTQSAAQTPPFVIIVHTSNTLTAVSQNDLSSIFLKRKVLWTDGTRIAPVDLGKLSPVREQFSKKVHHRSTASVSIYWQQQIFSGKDTPPPEKASDADIVAFVRANPGAVGYVAPGTTLGSGVKVVAVKD